MERQAADRAAIGHVARLFPALLVCGVHANPKDFPKMPIRLTGLVAGTAGWPDYQASKVA